MEITKIEALPISIPYKGSFRTSKDIRPKRAEYVLVKVHTDEGIIGIGESDPGPIVGRGETQGSVIYAIRNHLTPVITGEDPFNIEKLVEKMKLAINENWLAKASIEIALFDIMGKALNVPVYKLLGGHYRGKTQVSYGISATSLEDVIAEATHAINEGFSVVKVKVGWLTFQKELERLKAVHKVVGSGTEIMIDANQAWTPKFAIKILREAENLNVSFCEQPVSRWDLKGMLEVKNATSISIIADESLVTHHDALDLIRDRVADAFNVYIIKSGGLWGAKKIISSAEAANIPCKIGSTLELDVMTSAMAHLATASPNVSIASDIIGPLYFQDSIVVESIKIENGFAYTPNKPGLGVELSDDKIRRYLI